MCEENWQSAIPTIKERSKFIFNNDLFSDVKFVIGEKDSDGGKRRKQVIPAHKLVLSISSPVFEAMFYGKLAETRDSIELPDCEYDSLLELFRYMYSDEVTLSGSNVMGVLYSAAQIYPNCAYAFYTCVFCVYAYVNTRTCSRIYAHICAYIRAYMALCYAFP